MNILFGGLLLLSTNILQGYGQNISESRDLTATLNQDLTLSWTFSGSTAFKIAAFQLFKDSIAPLNLLNFGSLTILSPQGKAAFGERFVIEKNDWSAGELITKLKNVQFNDTGRIFILNILYQIGETIINPPRQSTYNISKVEGGPVACHDPLKSTYTYDEYESPSISLTLCGVPKPTVQWNFNSRDINTGASSQPSSTVPFGFKYDVTLPSLTQNLCGKTLTYSASGHPGINVLQGSSKILINFQPSLIENIVFFQESESCNSVTWTALDVGDCSVTYTVEYLNSTGASILNVTGITSQRDCNPQSKNAFSVRVWAVSGHRIGVIGRPTTLSLTTTTTTAVTTTRITASVGKTDSDDGDDNIVIIIGVVCGVLAIIIVIIIIVVYCKKKKNGNVMHEEKDVEIELKKPPSYHEEGEYVGINNRPLRTENHNQGLYAELGAGGGRNARRPDPTQSNYAEVRVDERGYPARGPISDMPAIPPTYAQSLNGDLSRRYNPPPNPPVPVHLDDMDEGVIV